MGESGVADAIETAVAGCYAAPAVEGAWRMLAEIDAARFITHRFPVSRADEAYDLLDWRPDETVQVMLTYGA